MKVAVNLLSITDNATGIGAYARAFMHCTKAPHRYLYITHPGLDMNLEGASQQFIVEKPGVYFEQLYLPTEMLQREVDVYHSPLFTCPLVDEVPSIITIHDAIPEVRPDLCTPKYLHFYRSQIGPALRACWKIVTTSEFSRREIIEHLNVEPEKIEVIYQGISSRFCPKSEAEISWAKARMKLPEKYLLYVGIIDARKNLEALIEAFAKTAKKDLDLYLVLAGRKDDPGYPLERAIESPGAGKRIILPGYLPEDDLPRVYAGAFAFVFPSLYEGFGRPVVEAMACGIPVIASNTASLVEIAKDAALLVEPDPESLYEAIEKIADLRSTMLNSGYLLPMIYEKSRVQEGKEKKQRLTKKYLQAII